MTLETARVIFYGALSISSIIALNVLIWQESGHRVRVSTCIIFIALLAMGTWAGLQMYNVPFMS